MIVWGGSTITRLFPDGSIDVSFNSSGKVKTSFNIKDVALQSDEKIVAVGDNVIARFNTSGQLDPTFDSDGMRIKNGFWDAQGTYRSYEAVSVRVQNDG